MGVLKIVDTPPSFATGQALSAEMLNILRDNALALAEASYLGVSVHQDRYQIPPENNDQNPVTVWRGGFTFLDEMDTLRVVTFTSGQQSGDVLRVYRGDGSGTYSEHTLANGLQTFTITIDGSGYDHGQVVLLRLDLYNSGGSATAYNWGNIDIREVTAYPVQLADSFPGVPSFGAISAANLNQLAECIDWLTRRVALRYEPLFQAVIRRIGPYYDGSATQADVRMTGSLRRSPAQAEIVARGTVDVRYGATESIRLNLNGSVVDTYSVSTAAGTYGWELTASLGAFSTDTLVPFIVDYIRTGGTTDPNLVNRWSVYEVFTRPTSGTPATLAEQAARVPGTFTALQTWLNALCTIVDDAYDRFVANYPVWQGQRAYRARFGIDDYQFKVFEPWGVAVRQSRTGEAVYVRGKGVSLGYGPGRFFEDKQNEVGAYEFENFRRETVIDADAVETQRFYLDTAPGLPAGAPYNLRGVDLYYAAEQLKVYE